MNNSILIDNPDRLIAKAWADEDFKTALLANPRAALKAQGYDLIVRDAAFRSESIDVTQAVLNSLQAKAKAAAPAAAAAPAKPNGK